MKSFAVLFSLLGASTVASALPAPAAGGGGVGGWHGHHSCISSSEASTLVEEFQSIFECVNLDVVNRILAEDLKIYSYSSLGAMPGEIPVRTLLAKP